MARDPSNDVTIDIPATSSSDREDGAIRGIPRNCMDNFPWSARLNETAVERINGIRISGGWRVTMENQGVDQHVVLNRQRQIDGA